MESPAGEGEQFHDTGDLLAPDLGQEVLLLLSPGPGLAHQGGLGRQQESLGDKVMWMIVMV